MRNESGVEMDECELDYAAGVKIATALGAALMQDQMFRLHDKKLGPIDKSSFDDLHDEVLFIDTANPESSEGPSLKELVGNCSNMVDKIFIIDDSFQRILKNVRLDEDGNVLADVELPENIVLPDEYPISPRQTGKPNLGHYGFLKELKRRIAGDCERGRKIDEAITALRGGPELEWGKVQLYDEINIDEVYTEVTRSVFREARYPDPKESHGPRDNKAYQGGNVNLFGRGECARIPKREVRVAKRRSAKRARRLNR